jgi:tetratricopeptide (TPR) repeat protein
LGIATKFGPLATASAQFRKIAADAYNRLGQIDADYKNYELAYQEYENGLAIQKQLIVEFPDDLVHIGNYVACLERFGEAYRRNANPEMALKMYTDALPYLESIVNHDRDNTIWKRKLVEAHIGIGRLTAQSDPDRAIALYKQAITMQEDLAKIVVSNKNWQNNLIKYIYELSDLLSRKQRFEEVKEQYKAVVEIRKRLVEAEPNEVAPRRRFAQAYEALGDAEAKAGRPAEAKDAYRRGVEVIDQFTRDHADAGLGTLRATIQTKLDAP